MENSWIKKTLPPLSHHISSVEFPKLDQYDRRIKGGLALFVASIYHLVDEKYHEELNNKLNNIFQQMPKLAEFIGRHDINVNIGMRKKIYGSVLGTHGIDNRNKKGRRLLGLLLTNSLKVTNSFFKK